MRRTYSLLSRPRSHTSATCKRLIRLHVAEGGRAATGYPFRRQ